MSRTALTPQPWLSPLGSLFGGIGAVRAALYRRRLLTSTRLGGPVISVGNLSVGGSGKTPLVARLARTLAAEGRAVAILSRGYGGDFAGDCLIVSDGRAVLSDASHAGDEPVMLAQALPGVVVAVGRRRDRVGVEVERRFGPRVHVLDDGFQHLRLERDCDLVCVSVDDLDDRPLPAGRLRETRAALDRAHALLLSADAASEARVRQLATELGSARTFLVRRRGVGFFSKDGGAAPIPSRAFVLSGIARPERLIDDVRRAGVEIVGHASFSDHHRFATEEIAGAARLARERNADALVTTEKDVLRFPFVPAAPPLAIFRIDVDIEDEPRLLSLVHSALERRS
jgi:tetraacyldisaccharide 4'-kinase